MQKIIKRITSLLLVGCCAFSAIACQGGGSVSMGSEYNSGASNSGNSSANGSHSDLNDDSGGSEIQVDCGHSYTREVLKEPTCVGQGTILYTCSICGDNYIERTEATGEHSYTSEITKEATCQEEGVKTYTCSICGDNYIEGIKATGEHSYTSEITKEATCQEKGITTYTCGSCGNSYTENYEMTELSASEVFEQSKNSVGEIITYDKNGEELALGTGFVYSADGKILTNYHVIEDAYSAKITINGKNYTIQTILAYDKTIDLAMLKINAGQLPVTAICNKEHSVGKAVYAFGSSRGLTATFSQGIITCADRELDGVHYVQHDAAISSGNSGGPLINQYGEIIGINTMTITDSQNLNFAISIKELSNLVYGTPLTFAEFYEKESDVFTKVKNYIIQNGEYDYEDKDYTIDFGYVTTNSGLIYSTGASYDTVEGEIELTLFFLDDEYSGMVFVTIDAIDGVYGWSYIDSDYYYMSGTIYATTFTSNTVLSYSYYSGIPTASLRVAVKELASVLIGRLIADINYDYADIRVEAADFGFIYF